MSNRNINIQMEEDQENENEIEAVTEDDEFFEMVRSQNNIERIKKSSENRNILRNDIPSLSSSGEEQKKLNKIPPITIYEQTSKQTVEILSRNKICDFEIKKINEKKHILLTKSKNTYTTAIDRLKDVQCPFYTFTPKDEKSKIMLLKGLNEHEDEKEILEELKHYENEKLEFVNVKRFKSKYAEKNNTILPILLIQITNSSDLNELYKIKYIQYHRIVWEKLKSSGIKQCFNCQRYGHAANNCNLNYRCVRCDKEHNPGECKLEKGDLDKNRVFCTNCNKFGHPASYRGCETYKNLIKKIRERQIDARKIEPKKFTSSYIKEGVKFSDMFQDENKKQQMRQQDEEYGNNKIRNGLLENIKTEMEMFKEYIKENNKRMEEMMNIIISMKQDQK